ncbi:MAG: hypothetical protein O2921_02640 [Chloroflexi bacterium]|nr:hypothetical protein [Chloroflexota bacterium]MDA1281513.1 hypothetical protein [Chloroflexota bacterium]
MFAGSVHILYIDMMCHAIDDLIKAHKMGALDFRPKPWTRDDLIKRIRWASLTLTVLA